MTAKKDNNFNAYSVQLQACKIYNFMHHYPQNGSQTFALSTHLILFTFIDENDISHVTGDHS